MVSLVETANDICIVLLHPAFFFIYRFDDIYKFYSKECSRIVLDLCISNSLLNISRFHDELLNLKWLSTNHWTLISFASADFQLSTKWICLWPCLRHHVKTPMRKLFQTFVFQRATSRAVKPWNFHLIVVFCVCFFYNEIEDSNISVFRAFGISTTLWMKLWHEVELAEYHY